MKNVVLLQPKYIQVITASFKFSQIIKQRDMLMQLKLISEM